MKQLNWGDELCGKVITPEGWAGGIVEYDMPDVTGLHGMWRPLLLGMDFPWGKASRPIYPPTGWSGKTEDELWDAMVNQGRKPLYYAEISVVVHVKPDGELFMGNLYSSQPIRISDTLILALQNAQVLSKRLKEARDA